MSAAAPAALPKGINGYIALLKSNSDIRNIWLAQSVSQFGDWFNSVALLGLVNEITHDAMAPALVQTLTVLPNALASLTFGGYLADRFDRRIIAISIDVARAVVAAALLFVNDASTLWIAWAVIVFLSLGEAIFGPAISAAQPNLCEPHELATANALQQSTWASVSMLGAFVGGVVTTIFGRQTAFVINALSFAMSALFLLRVRGSFNSAGRGAGRLSLHALTEGAAFLARTPHVLGISTAKMIFSIVFATAGLYSVFSYRVYDSGDAGTSWLYAARGIGSFLGPILLPLFFQPKTLRDFVIVMIGGFSLGAVGYAFWGATTLPIFGIIGVFLGHLGSGNLWANSRIYVQRETPDALRGRVMALDMVGFTFTMGVLGLVWGAVAQRTSPGMSVLAAVGIAAVLFAPWLFAMGRMLRSQHKTNLSQPS